MHAYFPSGPIVAHSAQDYVGSYRLLTLLRIGKTCQVWEVINDLNSERRALKLLLPEFMNDRQEVGFLRHEHEVGLKLDHPRVIKIHDFGLSRVDIYLAMELFPAPNVKQIIHQGIEQLVPVVCRVIRQAAEGLAYFHAQGWIHRDVKPDNFLMKPNGEVKLIDFALAQRRRQGLAKLFARKSKIQGTRSYMSPEQVRGQALDERADIYSFGCMVHELLGGRPPFTGSSTNELLTKHLRSAPPSLQSANRNVTDRFSALVRSMLAKSPVDRPPSMVEFLREFNSTDVFKSPPATQLA